MTDKPILFSSAMVRAILDGRKTVTRRVIKGEALRWLNEAGFSPEFLSDIGNASLWPYAPGDRLWVRETMRVGDQALIFDADEAVVPKGSLVPESWALQYGSGRIPSTHMPRWASRLTLTVTDVRAERVQEISEGDAVLEGLGVPNTRPDSVYSRWDSDPRDEFCELWDSLNAKRGYGWDVNPWVWRIEFTAERRNIDAEVSDAA